MVLSILILIIVSAYIFYTFYDAYRFFFGKLDPLTISEKKIILNNFPVYRKLSSLQKQKFEYRIIRFRKDKQFVFNGLIPRQEEMALLLSATATMLTLGMKNYKIPAIHRIIIYPDAYYSKINRQNHIGEYNPGLKTIVFSAKHLKQGFEYPNDNKNLGIHEFAHALSFNALFAKRSLESIKFKKGLHAIKVLFNSAVFKKELSEKEYFRSYGTTNVHEFFAVAAENYVETPAVFYCEFPELYTIMNNMLNFDFDKP